jgi:hypothetical protein
MKFPLATLFAVLSLAVIASVPAQASSLTITSSVINGSGACTTTASTPCPDNYGFLVNSGVVNSVTAGPTTYNIGDALNQGGSPPSTANDFGASVYTSSPAKCPPSGSSPNCLNSSPLLTWNFQDNYEFLTPGSGPTVQGAVVSFTVPSNIGLSGLEARIVTADDTSAAGTVAVSANTVVDGWQNVSMQSGPVTTYTTTLNTTALNANTDYILQIRGEADTAASYGGSVTFVPVPLPASVLLLFSAFSALLLVTYRERLGTLSAGGVARTA